MPQVRWIMAIGAVGVLGLGAAQAQVFGGHHAARGGAGGGGPQQVDCDMVAANPDAGMDKASCEAMNQAAASYYNAQHDPAASRPGDEQMSCSDIKAEFMQQPVTAPSREHLASAQAATTAYMTATAAAEAKMMAQATALSAASLAASATSLLNPIAGRAADQAVNAAQQTMEAADKAEARAVMTPLAHKVSSSTAAVVGDISPQLDSNPRIARLVALASEKHCRGW